MIKNTNEIRQVFLDFFQRKGHQVVESSSLVPDNDPTLLFTNAGMNQFKDVFLGLDSRPYRRATTAQRCLRAGGKHNDLTNVGYTERHHTFFEMLGNFSFGDYFKYDAIQFAWELLTSSKWLNISKDRLWVTVYHKDHDTYKLWIHTVGMPKNRIIIIGDKNNTMYSSDNFWQMGDTGPCGPCSEILYDQGEHIRGEPPSRLGLNGERYIEIWNLVFIQFNRHKDGTLSPLYQPSVDTGMGLERISSILQNVHSNYEIELFQQLIHATEKVTGATHHRHRTSLRTIADHIRSCAFLINDGVLPTHEGRGYVLRRIIRRAVRHGNKVGSSSPFFYKLVSPLIEVMGSIADPLKLKQATIEKVLREEEEHFSMTLKRGMELLEKALSSSSHLNGNILDGEIAFRLYDTYGFPLDLTSDICRERNLYVDDTGFERAMSIQRHRARKYANFSYDHKTMPHFDTSTIFLGYDYIDHQACVIALFRDDQPIDMVCKGQENIIVILDQTPFYGESGGQIGDIGQLTSSNGIFTVSDTKKYGEMVIHLGYLNYGTLKVGDTVTAHVDQNYREKIMLNHSATHLLQSALRQGLGMHVEQKGSLVHAKYLRFDFSHNESLHLNTIHLIEHIVNENIRKNIPIITQVMSLDSAKKTGAIALFQEKYKDPVRVLSIGNVSMELCSGIHAKYTGSIGLFIITSESGIANGIRRIEAVTGENAINFIHETTDLVHHLTHLVRGTDKHSVLDNIRALQNHSHQLEQEIQKLKRHRSVMESNALLRKVQKINGIPVLVSHIETDIVDSKMLRTIVDELKNQLKSAVIVLSTIASGKAHFISCVTSDIKNRINAIELMDHLTKQVGGTGGGRPVLAQGGTSTTNITALYEALDTVNTLLAEIL